MQPLLFTVSSADANKMERFQQEFEALCFNRFFPYVYCRYSYAYALEY
jgi:hypothetical protein